MKRFSLWMLSVTAFALSDSGILAFTQFHAPRRTHTLSTASSALSSTIDSWKGEVVSNDPEGKINGCSIENVGESITDWVITIDGVEADLGRFSEAIYKKITADARQQQFQGFRPGTIPPHIEPTYRAFAMDECARETVLEAMQQNNIRPFENARDEFELESFWIPPPIKKNKKKKKKKRSKNKAAGAEEPKQEEVTEPQWQFFEGMKGAVDAGWKPGQSFSFIAKNVKGQKVLGESETEGSKALGLNF